MPPRRAQVSRQGYGPVLCPSRGVGIESRTIIMTGALGQTRQTRQTLIRAAAGARVNSHPQSRWRKFSPFQRLARPGRGWGRMGVLCIVEPRQPLRVFDFFVGGWVRPPPLPPFSSFTAAVGSGCHWLLGSARPRGRRREDPASGRAVVPRHNASSASSASHGSGQCRGQCRSPEGSTKGNNGSNTCHAGC